MKLEHEHPTQGIASTFLRALADDDPAAVFELLSRETRGRLLGAFAARAGMALHEAASSERIEQIVAPLRASVLAAVGGIERLGVTGGRVVGRGSAYVLLVPNVEESGLIAEAQWHPTHLIAFVHESREWLVDLERTAALSADAGLPDPFGGIS